MVSEIPHIKLYAFLRKFAAAERGNVLVTFALALVPLFGLIGASVDYGHASAIRTALQSAIDSTALALARQAASQKPEDLQASAQQFFNAQFARSDLKNITITASYSADGGSHVDVIGGGKMDTSFMGVLGFRTIDIKAKSTSAWGNTRLRVALALDNTGSMASANKMTALKTATKSLLTQFQASAASAGDVYVSIIPFSRTVNASTLGTSTATWIGWTSTPGNTDGWDDQNGSCSGFLGFLMNTRQKCTNTWTVDGHSAWNGCFMDRDKDNDIKNTAPTAALPSTLFPATQDTTCPVSMMGLSYDWTNLNKKVDAMTPTGNTNQAIGLAWAWQSLTQAPFTIPAEENGYNYQKVIILLTDGLNTQNRWSSNQTTIDDRQKLMCDNVKAAGIMLFTIQVNTDGDPMSQMLKDCASSPDKFFPLTTGNEIATAFQLIGSSLTKLRIAQ